MVDMTRHTWPFFSDQLRHELERGRYSSSLGNTLLPRMFCMPIYAVPKPGSTDLRLVNDHSAGPYSLNSMINHSLVTGYPLDNLHQLGDMLLNLHVLTPGLDLVMWKSDIAEAYRMCPMHPMWKIKQAVRIDGKYYIDRTNCFGSSASFAIFISVNRLIAWIAKNDHGISSLITYVDDSSGPAVATDKTYYDPYGTSLPSPQVTLLCLWDELGIPHKPKKQVHSSPLPIIGIDVNPNNLAFTLPDLARRRLITELETWMSPSSTHFRLHWWQKLGGWINWVLNVFPDLRPCLNAFYSKIAGKSQASLYVRINNDIHNNFIWALSMLELLPPVRLLHSLAWTQSEADVTVFCNACSKGMGFWIPDTNNAFYCPTPPDAPPLIYYVEALCVLAALSHCCSSMTPNQKLLLYTDNSNVVDILSSLRCRAEFNTILKHTVTTRVQSQVDLWVLHIWGEMNTVADAISRAEFDRAKVLAADLSVPNLSINNFPPPSPTNTNPLQPPSYVAGGYTKMNFEVTSGRQPSREPWPMDRLLQERAIALGNTIEPATLRTYNSALTSYLTFICTHNLPTSPSKGTLSFYVVYMSHHISPRSVTTYLSGIVQQLEPFYPLIRDIRNSKLVQRTLQGCLKSCAQPTRRKRALTISDLTNVLAHFNNNPTGHDNLLFLSMLFTGFFSLMRLGETMFLFFSYLLFSFPSTSLPKKKKKF